MKESLNLKYDAELKKNISEITSISLENDYEIIDLEVKGNFIVEGTYKSHGLSLNQDSFNFKVPYSYKTEGRVDEDSIRVSVSDFTYTIESNTLCLDISYDITYEEETNFDDLEEFNRFLDEHEVDIIDFTEKEQEEPIELEYEPIETFEEETEIDTLEEELPLERNNEEIKETIINNISDEENYITYYIYICNETDTLESIATKYNVTHDLLKEYNDITEITLGTKLIIPYTND